MQVYDQRVVYTGTLFKHFILPVADGGCAASVDDGSGKIDCNLRASSQPAAHTANTTKPPAATATSKHQATSSETKLQSPEKPRLTISTLPEAPKPIAAVGDIVKVDGKVLNRRYTRLINLDSLSA